MPVIHGHHDPARGWRALLTDSESGRCDWPPAGGGARQPGSGNNCSAGGAAVPVPRSRSLAPVTVDFGLDHECRGPCIRRSQVNAH
jgi:hypothetical protein